MQHKNDVPRHRPWKHADGCVAGCRGIDAGSNRPCACYCHADVQVNQPPACGRCNHAKPTEMRQVREVHTVKLARLLYQLRMPGKRSGGAVHNAL